MKPHTPRKRFGQHFLIDDEIIQHIVDVIHPVEGEHLVEIGPGQGALTFPVLNRISEIDVVELDYDLIPILLARSKKFGTLHVHQADALQFNFATLVKDNHSLRVIGNLPYNISTPLIFHLLNHTGIIADMHFMLQKEVVDRITAHAGDPAYGRLSIMVQYHCEAYALFDVPPEAFSPPPKVNSSIVRLVPFRQKRLLAQDYRHFENIVRQAFNQRRKTLRNCLKKSVLAETWEALQIDSNLRPEELTVQDYIQISNASLDNAV